MPSATGLFVGIGKAFAALFGFLWSKKAALAWIFGFGLPLGSKILRFLGFLSFISIITTVISVYPATQGTWKDKTRTTTFTLVKEIVSVDQNIYEISQEYSKIQNPSLLQLVKTSWRVVRLASFYYWWFWFFKNIVILGTGFWTGGKARSIPLIELYVKAFAMLYIFLLVTNIASVFINKNIEFEFIHNPNAKGFDRILIPLNNIKIAISTVLGNWTHFLLGFKGLLHFIIMGPLKYFILLNEPAQAAINHTVNTT